MFLRNGQKAWLLAPENWKWEFCSAFTLTLCLCFSASVLLGPCPNSHTPECVLPRSPFRSYGLSFKMRLAHLTARLCRQASICVCISSVVVTLKFVELFCFDRTVTSRNLLLTKNICTTFFSSLYFNF